MGEEKRKLKVKGQEGKFEEEKQGQVRGGGTGGQVCGEGTGRRRMVKNKKSRRQEERYDLKMRQGRRSGKR